MEDSTRRIRTASIPRRGKLGLFIRREVYGIFLRFMSEAGQNSYNNLSEFEKRSLTIVPDLTIEHTAEGSPIQAPGTQMWEWNIAVVG